MEFDHIIIGSGLSALATAMGLPRKARTLVLTGGTKGGMTYYDGASRVPSTFIGLGGLGEYWHGVVPMGFRNNFANASTTDFIEFFSQFYPHTDIAQRIGKPWLFVPYRAIRPDKYWRGLLQERDRLQIRAMRATLLEDQSDRIHVAAEGESFTCKFAWLAAGALHTPRLLATSFDASLARQTADDHAIIYLGLVDQSKTYKHIVPRPHRDRGGMWLPLRYSDTPEALLTTRPARFDFKTLDSGIKRRTLFGLPTGNAVVRLLTRPSPGLVAEAFFNKFGLFPRSRFQSAYAQFPVMNAYGFNSGTAELTPRNNLIVAAAQALRSSLAIDGLLPSRQTELFIPGIHLHNTVRREALDAANIDVPNSRILIADASTLTNIGPDHHSFKMMLSSFLRARSVAI